MLKRFVPQKPMPPVREEPRFSGPDENNHPANGEEPIITSTIIDKPKPMADNGGKDILSSDVEIKGELKSKCSLQGYLKAARLVIEEGATFIGKSEVTSGSISAKSAPARPEVVRSSEPIKAAFGGR